MSFARASAAATALCALFAAPDGLAVGVPSVYDNEGSYPVGSRAAGMAGAYTALGCDEAALHYNVAALGCARASRIELSANAYVIESQSLPDAFGAGQDSSGLTYHSIPTAVGTAIIVRRPDDEPSGAGRVVLGFSVEVPRSISLKLDPSSATASSFIRNRVRDDLLTGDLGVGWQINRYLAIGAALGAGLHTVDFTQTVLATGEQRVANCGTSGKSGCLPFVLIDTDFSAIAVGAYANAGVRVTPTPEWSIGLSFVSPSLDIYGSGDGALTAALAVPAGMSAAYDAQPHRATAASDLSLPARLALGIARSSGRFTISLDGTLNFPRDVAELHDFSEQPIDGIAPLDAATLAANEIHLHQSWQPNARIGFELRASERVALDFGAFTDFSAVDEQDVDNRASPRDRVHMFGGTAALQLIGKQIRSVFGLSFEGGAAVSHVLPGMFDLNNIVANGPSYSDESMITRWTLAGFIGSSYSFDKD